MISAKEAKELFDHSGKEIQDYLTYKIEKDVVKAAKEGKRSVFISIDTVAPYEHVSQKITPLEKGVLAELQKLGYRVEIKKNGTPYVPRGLADDDGQGPSHTNYGFHISW